MMGLFNQAGNHLRAFTGSAPAPNAKTEDDKAPSDTEPDDTSIL